LIGQKLSGGISVPKISVEGSYVSDASESNKETLNCYSIKHLQRIKQFPVFNDAEFRFACKKGTEIIDYRAEEGYKSFVLDRDVSDVLGHTILINPLNAKKTAKVGNVIVSENFVLRVIFVLAGIVSLIIAVFIGIYKKMY
jgi:hypothetical protein